MKSRGLPGGKRFPPGVPLGNLSKSSQLRKFSIGRPKGWYVNQFRGGSHSIALVFDRFSVLSSYLPDSEKSLDIYNGALVESRELIVWAVSVGGPLVALSVDANVEVPPNIPRITGPFGAC